MFDLRYTDDIVLLIWMGIAFFLSKNATKKKVTVLGQEEERYSLLFAILVFYPLFWFVTTVFARSDMYAYWSGFSGSNETISQVFQNWNENDKGPGYSLLVAIMKSLGLNSFHQYRVTIALLHSIPLLFVYWKYSDDYVYSIFLFIASMSYDSWMMNGLRQFLAACMIFATIPLLLKKKYVFTLLIILAAMTIHKSAMVMIPLLILAHFKPWSKLTIVFMITFAIVLYFYIYNSDWLSDETLQEDDGSNPIRILINLIPVVLAFVGRKQIALANNTLINMCVNISLVNVIMFAIASVTSGIMVGRLPGYTTIFNFLLFPYLLNRVFNEKKSKNLKFFITGFYVLYFIADLYFI